MSGGENRTWHEHARRLQLPGLLLVDHDAELAYELARVLEGVVPVLVRGTVAEASRYLHGTRRLCALVTRKTLPDGPGLTIVRRARGVDPDLPCLELIAELAPSDTRRSLFAGATAIARASSVAGNVSFIVEYLDQYMRPADRHLLAAARLAPGDGALTRRQVICLAAVMDGRSPALIAAQLGIRVKTVEEHLYQARLNVGVGTRDRLVARASRASASLLDGICSRTGLEQWRERRSGIVDVVAPFLGGVDLDTPRRESDTDRSRTRLRAVRDDPAEELSTNPRGVKKSRE